MKGKKYIIGMLGLTVAGALVLTGCGNNKNSEQKDEKLKHLFDLLLVLKPYLLNMKTFNLYQAESAK